MEQNILNFKNSLIFRIHYLVLVTDKLASKQLQESVGLSLSQFLLLSMLQCSPAVNQKRIASWLGVSEVSVSKQIAQLEKLGLIEKQENQPDRKQQFWQLTTKGQDKFQSSIVIMDSLSKQWQALLEESELRLLYQVVDKLLIKLQANN
jgi:DNA-binding MarR family transcriptional regulator